MIKKNTTTLNYQQKQWIEHAYADIKEDPMSYGIKDIISDKDFDLKTNLSVPAKSSLILELK